MISLVIVVSTVLVLSCGQAGVVYLQGKNCVIHTWALHGWGSHDGASYSFIPLPFFLCRSTWRDAPRVGTSAVDALARWPVQRLPCRWHGPSKLVDDNSWRHQRRHQLIDSRVQAYVVTWQQFCSSSRIWQAVLNPHKWTDIRFDYPNLAGLQLSGEIRLRRTACRTADRIIFEVQKSSVVQSASDYCWTLSVIRPLVALTTAKLSTTIITRRCYASMNCRLLHCMFGAKKRIVDSALICINARSLIYIARIFQLSHLSLV